MIVQSSAPSTMARGDPACQSISRPVKAEMDVGQVHSRSLIVSTRRCILTKRIRLWMGQGRSPFD